MESISEFFLLFLLCIPIFCLQKIKIKDVPDNSLMFIVVLQGIVFIVKNNYLDESIMLVGMILTCFFYFVVSNSLRLELTDSFPKIYDEKKLKRSSVKFFYGFFLIVLRYVEMAMFFYYSILFLVSITPLNRELLNNIVDILKIEMLIIFCVALFAIIFYYTRIQYRRLLMLAFFFICLGRFDLKYWTIITILTSILALTFSENFVREFIKEKVLNSGNLYFFKFITIYSTLLLYISVVVVKDIITHKRIIHYFEMLMEFQTKDATEMPTYLVYIIAGILELLIFVFLWGRGKSFFKKMNIFNYLFFQQITYIENKVKFSIKKIR
ncbi:hypothetical protein [Enterococcus sp. 5H]|uniref:hypothetical protein n=1 Tax=Enterococcus sp. 5H TaxID=1229490 RepID=UPI00230477A3|nr:hypothetical protein [Enterococcus sp. 5H]MDA9470057.1 hypothetical protein [Enterococcus sp. 5H]